MKRIVLLSLILISFVFAGRGWSNPVFMIRGAQSKASLQTVMVATSEAELKKIRTSFLPDLREKLDVDFDNEVAVFAFGGRCPSAGYRVEIDHLSYESKGLEISMKVVRPEGGFFAQVITSPWVVMTLKK